MGLIEKAEVGGIGGSALERQPQPGSAAPDAAGQSLEITGAAAAPQDLQHRHQQQASRVEAHQRAVTAIGSDLEATVPWGQWTFRQRTPSRREGEFQFAFNALSASGQIIVCRRMLASHG
jgi:hypothetical protein